DLHNVRKFLIFIIASLLPVHYVSAQQDAELNIALEKLTHISLTENAQGMTELTSPRLIRVMGGKENALKLFKESYLSLGDQGLKIDTVINYTDTGIFETNKIRFSFIPQLLV